MMAYSFFRFSKIKSTSSMQKAYKHNYRVFDVANANPSLSPYNDEMKNSERKEYSKLYAEELERLKSEGSQKKAVRKDAVLGFEVVLSFSRDAMKDINLDAWIRENIKWLESAYNPPDHRASFTDDFGRYREFRTDNVKSVIVHYDEATPHIHAFVVPVDDKGKLNASYYNHGRLRVQELKDGYSKIMKDEFGLEPGVKNSIATHQDIARYHTMIEQCVHASLPDPEKNETLEDYKLRADKQYQDAMLKIRALEVQLERKNVREHYEMNRHTIDENMAKAKLESQLRKLSKMTGREHIDEYAVREIRRNMENGYHFEQACRDYPDREQAEKIRQDYYSMIQWEKDRTRHKRRDKNRDDINKDYPYYRK